MRKRTLWLKVLAFMAGTLVLDWTLPAHPGLRMMAFIISCMALTKSLEKRS